MFRRGDFHIHTTASDGDLNPTQLIIAARSNGIDTVAITDHNTIDGIESAVVAGRLYGVSVVPGVELSTRYNGESIHILGYFKDYTFYNSIFIKVLRLVNDHRIKEARKILCNLMYTETAINHLSIFEGINFLRAFGASVVLAHPVRISKSNLSYIINMPFDGIEAKYPLNNYSDTCFFVNIALAGFSFYTGGSDFHSYSNHQKHGSLGQPSLNSEEIKMFLRNSGVIVLS